MKEKILTVFVMLLLISTINSVSAETTTIIFSHQEEITCENSRTGPMNRYEVAWSLTITAEATFPVHFDVQNSQSIEPASDDELSYQLIIGENEGEVVITFTAHITVTKKGIFPKEVHKQITKPVQLTITTPIGETKIPLIEIPVPFEFPPLPPVIVTLQPTLYFTPSVRANCTVQGLATISQNSLEWFEKATKTVTVHASDEAKGGDQITISLKDISYFWNAQIELEIKLEHILLFTSQRYSFKTYSIPADNGKEILFNIQVGSAKTLDPKAKTLDPKVFLIGIAILAVVIVALVILKRKH